MSSRCRLVLAASANETATKSHAPSLFCLANGIILEMVGVRIPEPVSDDEYHSYVLRIRARPAGSDKGSALAIRVEYVNKRKAGHFVELSGALDFIAESVRHEILQP